MLKTNQYKNPPTFPDFNVKYHIETKSIVPKMSYQITVEFCSTVRFQGKKPKFFFQKRKMYELIVKDKFTENATGKNIEEIHATKYYLTVEGLSRFIEKCYKTMHLFDSDRISPCKNQESEQERLSYIEKATFGL